MKRSMRIEELASEHDLRRQPPELGSTTDQIFRYLTDVDNGSAKLSTLARVRHPLIACNCRCKSNMKVAALFGAVFNFAGCSGPRLSVLESYQPFEGRIIKRTIGLTYTM